MNIKNKNKCIHCNDPILSPTDINLLFCCPGCEVIYNCLNDVGMQYFYDIAKEENKKIKPAMSGGSYDFVKSEGFLQKFGHGNQVNTFYFYVEGIDCMACSWVFANLEKVNSEIIYSKFFQKNNVLELSISSQEELCLVLKFISRLGHRLIPLVDQSEADTYLKKEKRNELIRLGVTAAIWMNMMIFSVSIYAGVNGYLKELFINIISVFFIPIIFYSAIPFYKSVYAQLKRMRPSIDVPIVTSIIFGAYLSYKSVLDGGDKVYFDSLTMFIFFILSTRYCLSFLYRKEVSHKLFDGVYGEQQAWVYKGENIVPTHLTQVKMGDIIQIRKSEIVPLDGEIINSHSYFNESLVSGESTPVLHEKGALIVAGVKNLTNVINLKVTSSWENNSFRSFFAALNINPGQLEGYSKFGGLYSLYLTISIVLISIILFFFDGGSSSFDKILSLLIICCPCALGVGIPLATILKLKSLALKGIIVKDNSIFEKFNKTNKIFFDKTGTITTGKYTVKECRGDPKYLSYLYEIEKKSEHPIAKSLCNYFSEYENLNLLIDNFIEIPGKGVEGLINGEFVSVCSNINGDIILQVNHQVVLTIMMEEHTASENISILSKLTEKYKVSILTGDKGTNVNRLILRSDFPTGVNVKSSLTPNEKQSILQQETNSIYVGDGLNDVLAMREASLSISLNHSKLVDDVCSVVFNNGNLNKLNILFNDIDHLHSVIKWSIIISVIYNIAGVLIVVLDFATPLLAALVMPISSLFVVLYTFFRLRQRVRL